jgi:hypothetical protein
LGPDTQRERRAAALMWHQRRRSVQACSQPRGHATSTPKSCKLPVSFTFLCQNNVRIYLSHVCHMPCPSHPIWFDNWRCYLLPFRSTCSEKQVRYVHCVQTAEVSLLNWVVHIVIIVLEGVITRRAVLSVTLLSRVQEVVGSNLGWDRLSWLRFPMVFLSPFIHIPGLVTRLSQDHFLPNSFQFIFHPTMQRYVV